jgi:uncharacterized protein YjaZ
LLVKPGSIDPWLEANQPSSLTDTQYKKWLQDLKLPQHKMETFEKHIEKVMKRWKNQPDHASKEVQRVSVAMGIDPCKLKSSSTDDNVLKVLTVALMMNS